MAKGKPTLDNLDHYLGRKEYHLALSAIEEGLRRRPDNTNLMLREAEVLVLSAQLDRAIERYQQLAELYIEQGFYARAIAVTNKIQRLDPGRTELIGDLAGRISSRREAEQTERARLQRAATAPAPAASGGDRRSGTPELPEAAVADDAAAPGEPSIDDEHTAEEIAKERDASQFFAAFTKEALEELLSVTAVRSYRAGDVIVREGEPGASLFLIEEGHVDVRTLDPAGRDVSLAHLGPGDFFGEVSVLTGRPRTATILAAGAVTVIEIQQELLRGILERHPSVGDVLREFYERRAQATVATMIARLRGGNG